MCDRGEWTFRDGRPWRWAIRCCFTTRSPGPPGSALRIQLGDPTCRPPTDLRKRPMTCRLRGPAAIRRRQADRSSRGEHHGSSDVEGCRPGRGRDVREGEATSTPPASLKRGTCGRRRGPACAPWKGIARYFTTRRRRSGHAGAAWYYPDPPAVGSADQGPRRLLEWHHRRRLSGLDRTHPLRHRNTAPSGVPVHRLGDAPSRIIALPPTSAIALHELRLAAR